MISVIIILSLLLLELSLILLVRKFRKEFQWLITEIDELPELPQHALDKFINSSFDKELGWVKKPNTSGIEKGKYGDICFFIDSEGSRKTSFPDFDKTIAVFGDSYAFCRQVMDTETWEEGVSKTLNTGVLNYGVGNYGVDQALIRYMSETLRDSVKISILCFVPETICRIQSYWKHYLEFGNTFAFKPKFKLSESGELELVRCAIQTSSDFNNLKSILPQIQLNDNFYLRKFRKLQFRKPYILSLLRAPRRQFRLIGALMLNKFMSLINIKNEKYKNLAFACIMKYNIQESREMYSDDNAKLLLKKILLNFTSVAKSKGHKPLFLVIPQLLDFYEDKYLNMPYSVFYKELASEYDVIDMAEKFRTHELSDIYINDQYGGHLSTKGNELVAESVVEWVKMLNLLKPHL